MRTLDHFSLATQGVTASRFSLLSNTVSILVGLLFFGLLVSLSLGVTKFLEAYYTRTTSLTTLLVYDDPESSVDESFTKEYRDHLRSIAHIHNVVYHDINFADLAISQGKSVTAALRSGVADDPEIERLELVTGSNLRPFEGFDKFSIVIPLNRAQTLSDLPPDKLIGLELAISFLRTMDTEWEDQEITLYGTITGVVNETPDSCVYVPYEILAAAERWQRDLAAEKGLDESPAEPSDSLEEEAVEESTCTPDDEAEHAVDDGVAHPTFRFARVQDAWEVIADDVESDSLTYPHLRIHVDSVQSLIRLRKHFRERGNPTESVLDDVTAVRELRQYAIFVGACIGGITLVAALCSIFNTLLASVERRTREIGILRALGASRINVLVIFLLEGLINTVIGGIFAAILMYFATNIANQWLLGRLKDSPDFSKLLELQPHLFLYPVWLPVLIVSVGLLAALLASFFPALRACSIAPSAALRHE